MEQRTTDLVHSTFCSKTHTHDVGDLLDRGKQGMCHYYLEAQVEHGDGMEDHLLWAEKTRMMADSLELIHDDEVVRFIEHIGQVVVKFYLVLNLYPNSKEILKRALRL